MCVHVCACVCTCTHVSRSVCACVCLHVCVCVCVLCACVCNTNFGVSNDFGQLKNSFLHETFLNHFQVSQLFQQCDLELTVFLYPPSLLPFPPFIKCDLYLCQNVRSGFESEECGSTKNIIILVCVCVCLSVCLSATVRLSVCVCGRGCVFVVV